MKIEQIYAGCLAQGVGSACGKNMHKETTDTLGNQKKIDAVHCAGGNRSMIFVST